MTRSRDIADQQKNLGGAVAPFVGAKNFVINGGFDWWQRGTSVAISAGSPWTYTTDRWGIQTAANQAVTVSRQSVSDSTNLPNIQYCMRSQRNSGQTGTGSYFIDTALETSNSIPLAGKNVTVSFYARAGATFISAGDYLTVQLIYALGTDQNPSNWTSPAVITSITPSLTANMQRFSFTGTIPTNATQVFIRLNHTPVGTAGASDYYDITGVQSELGSVATPFSRAGGNIGGELALCQRYYTRNTATAAYFMFADQGMAGSTTNAWFSQKLPVTMRIAPTIEYSTTYSNYAIQLWASTVSISAITQDVCNVDRGVFYVTASGLTQYRPYSFISIASGAYLGWSAEL